MKILKYAAAFLIGTATMIGIVAYAPALKSKKISEYIDDTVMTVKIKEQLFIEPDLQSSEIHVETFKGKVQLSGFVSSMDNAKRALRITRSISGAGPVIDNMQIK